MLEPGSMMKADKATVVCGCHAIDQAIACGNTRDLRTAGSCTSRKITSDKLSRRAPSLQSGTRSSREKTELLHEKLRIEAQLQGFLASMPFASPVEGVTARRRRRCVATRRGLCPHPSCRQTKKQRRMLRCVRRWPDAATMNT